ncbi:polysaccharide biosynthesis tyrosine autokinase [Pseudoclavibacter sp. CFCC 13796]|uniref:polysaccharide biosynthesis tyrosine autokinase n=1 Tax=Pseudoclavibacter sp. CFCC 13796 TaxID=2615179 RepID=UPI0013018995|nr:polysaccharide biosynthesis tyrosine autokinase [Pseudoclavibacter sp. CFCC 13796]KAB1661088.1 polysaccharide biosynthesis tyrosine autokinase [Pseudoclavibacter sp. CFCC 13796]
MTLDEYIRVFRRYWYVLAIGIVAGVLVAATAAFLQPKTYTADSSGFITTPTQANDGGNSVGSAVAGDSYAKSRAKSYADLGKTRAVAQEVVDKLGLKTSPEDLVGQISVSVPLNTVTVKVTAKASTPQGASDLANAWIAAMGTQIARLESGQATDSSADAKGAESQGEPAATLTPLESAVVPTSPSSPNLKLYLAIGALVGLVAGLVYALVRRQYDRRIRSSDDIRRATETPIVGTLPIQNSLVNSRSRLSAAFGSSADPAKVEASTRQLNEALRELRTNISFLDVDRPPRSIVVTSALPGDGKSTVAANLAAVFSETGSTVVLIDGDLRKPTVADSFNLSGDLGLTDVLAGRTTLDVAMHRWSDERALFVLPAGSVPPNPSELLSSDAFHDLVKSFTEEGATVIIDAPPLLPVTDAAVLTARSDGALLVVAAGQTRVDSLSAALERLDSVKGRTLGVVLNRVPTKGLDKGAYGYYQGDYYGASEKGHEKTSVLQKGKTERPRRRRPAASQRHDRGNAREETSVSIESFFTDADPVPSHAPTKRPLLGDDTRP